MRHLVETGTKDTPPTLYGISFTITIAYRAHIQTSTDKRRKKHKHTKQTISSDRMDKLIADIKIWRQEALNDFASRFPELTVQIIFPDKRVMTVAGKAKNIGSKEDLIGALEECGYAFPESVIFKYTEDLYRCISDSLRESHPPPQLKTQFDQAVKRAVKRRRPAESTQMVSAIGQSTHCTPSIPLFTQQVSVLNIVKPLSQHTATLKIPNWPVPSVPSIVPSILPMFPIEKRVPLAEKHASNFDVINVSVQQLSFSPYNTRRSAARQSLAKQLSAGFSTSFDAVNEREIILSKGGNPRKRDQSDKENSVRSLPVDKKRNVVWINNIIVGVTWCSSELLGARRSYSVSGSLCRSRVTKGRSLLSVYIDERAPDNSDK